MAQFDVPDDHKRSFWQNERIVKTELGAQGFTKADPKVSDWVMMGAFAMFRKRWTKVRGTLYLTDHRLIFIRDLGKEEKIPKTPAERIKHRKDRELFHYFEGIKEVKVHKSRLGKKSLQVTYTPKRSTDTFPVDWFVKDPEEWCKAVKESVKSYGNKHRKRS